MDKCDKKIRLVFCLVLFASAKLYAQKSPYAGKYADTTCFRTNECCVSWLSLKKDGSYSYSMTGINHRAKNKNTEHGKWTVQHDLLILMPGKDSIKANHTYKCGENVLWYYSREGQEPKDIAFKKQNN
jgi:hypothetical protein